MCKERIGIAIGSLVCGIISVAMSALSIPLGLFFPIWGCGVAFAGVIIGIIAISLGCYAKNVLPAGRAIAGFVLGIVGTSLQTIIFICFLIIYFIF